MSTPTSRARLAVSAAVAAGLCLAGTATIAAPSHAVTGSCDEAYPVADLTAGDQRHRPHRHPGHQPLQR